MDSTLRYEEYGYICDRLPFVFHERIFRDASVGVVQSNWHENLEIELCMHGSGRVLLDGEEYSFEEGDVVVANSGVIHCTRAKTSLEYACLIIDVSFCRRVGIDPSDTLFESHFRSETIANGFKNLSELLLQPDTPLKTAKANEIVLKILIELCETRLVSFERKRVENVSFERVKKAIGYIRERYGEKLSLETLARVSYSDKYALSREFKKLTGQTIVTYLNRFRCQIAAGMIESGISVGEAAYACGFENLSFFTRTFKRFTGKLPSAFKCKNSDR